MIGTYKYEDANICKPSAPAVTGKRRRGDESEDKSEGKSQDLPEDEAKDKSAAMDAPATKRRKPLPTGAMAADYRLGGKEEGCSG
jgi:hypothetical protein